MLRPWLAAALAVSAFLPAACGGDDSSGPPRERADRPDKPPAGWHTVRNRRAGFTISVPRPWTARTKGPATLVRSRDRLLALTVTADRGEQGRETLPADYAGEVFENLPGFEGTVTPTVRRVRGSPYANARLDGSGSLRTARRPRGITVVTFHRPHRVTYSLVAFREPRLGGVDERALRGILRSFRAQPPRSGRSG